MSGIACPLVQVFHAPQFVPSADVLVSTVTAVPAGVVALHEIDEEEAVPTLDRLRLGVMRFPVVP
jgi:hypothetical protein